MQLAARIRDDGEDGLTGRRRAQSSNQDGAWLLGIHCRTTSQRRDPAESLVGRDKYGNVRHLPEIESSALEMTFTHRRDEEALPRKIGPKAPSGDFQ